MGNSNEAASQVSASIVLAQILAMRQAAEYQAAERVRQQVGAQTMALYPDSSIQNGQVRLMVNTWNTIAGMTTVPGFPWDQFCSSNPVGFMWDGLYPAIREIRKTTRLYARQFQKLNTSYEKWLKTQPKDYQSQVKQGINASFG
ncbi:MAG TPA: hypothetical protein VEG36_03490 [Burkholderiales bacterium]|nr:hypothetical protein [Burkholderiales bacterium]